MERRKYYYFKVLSLLPFLIILGALFSLNRLNGIIIDFQFRIYIEHFVAGFCIPLFLLYLMYFFNNFNFIFLRKEISLFEVKFEKRLLILYSIGYILFEVWWQFIKSPNFDSPFQFIFSFFGIIFLWLFLFKLTLTH